MNETRKRRVALSGKNSLTLTEAQALFGVALEGLEDMAVRSDDPEYSVREYNAADRAIGKLAAAIASAEA